MAKVKLEKQLGYSASEVELMADNLRNALFYLEGQFSVRGNYLPFGEMGMEDLWYILKFLNETEMKLKK